MFELHSCMKLYIITALNLRLKCWIFHVTQDFISIQKWFDTYRKQWKGGGDRGRLERGRKSHTAIDNTEKNASNIGRNGDITKIVIFRATERIKKFSGFWKRNERAFSTSRIYGVKRCNRRGNLWVFVVFHVFQSQLSRERKKIKIWTLFRWNCLAILSRIVLLWIFKFPITVRKQPPEKGGISDRLNCGLLVKKAVHVT